jgi:predicted DNA-binding transcriptional regulator YafY
MVIREKYTKMKKRKPNKKFPENRYTASEKLIAMIALLSDKRWHTTAFLAKQFGTTERTILRDLDKIENAAKVIVERRPGKGIRLQSKYKFKGVDAGAEEAINLILAVAYSPKIGFSLVQVAKTLDKLRDSLPPEFASQVDWFRSRFHFETPEYTDGLRFLELIREAILKTRRIHITHIGIGDGTTDEHNISPYGLVYYHSNWYLIGFDLKCAERRVFRIDRFQTCKMTKVFFNPPDNFDAQEHWYNLFWKQYGKNAETIVLTFDSEYEEHLKTWDNVELKTFSNGKIEATFKAMDLEWLKKFVLSAGSYVKVKKPKWLKEAIIAEINKMAKIYDK